MCIQGVVASNLPQSACPESVLEGCDMLDMLNLSRRCSRAHDYCTYISCVSSLVVSRANGGNLRLARSSSLARMRESPRCHDVRSHRSPFQAYGYNSRRPLFEDTTVAGMASMSSVVSRPSADLGSVSGLTWSLGLGSSTARALCLCRV